MGERVITTSRPGPGQWAALVRALDPPGHTPQSVPWAPNSLLRKAGIRFSPLSLYEDHHSDDL